MYGWNLCVVSRLGGTVSTGGLRGVDGGSLVGNIGDESVVVIGGVGGGLDPTVRKSDHERSGNVSGGILGLGLFEVGLAVVVVDSVLVGKRLGSKLLLLVRSGCSIGRGMVDGSISSHKGEQSRGDQKLKREKIK